MAQRSTCVVTFTPVGTLGRSVDGLPSPLARGGSALPRPALLLGLVSQPDFQFTALVLAVEDVVLPASSSRFICSCRRRSGCSSPAWHGGHWQTWTSIAFIGRTRSTDRRLRHASRRSADRPGLSDQNGKLILDRPLAERDAEKCADRASGVDPADRLAEVEADRQDSMHVRKPASGRTGHPATSASTSLSSSAYGASGAGLKRSSA